MTSQKVPVLSLIVPCKDEEPVLPETARVMKAKIESLVQRGMVDAASRIYFIDDGSADDTWGVICRLAESDDIRDTRLSCHTSTSRPACHVHGGCRRRCHGDREYGGLCALAPGPG